MKFEFSGYFWILERLDCFVVGYKRDHDPFCGVWIPEEEAGGITASTSRRWQDILGLGWLYVVWCYVQIILHLRCISAWWAIIYNFMHLTDTLGLFCRLSQNSFRQLILVLPGRTFASLLIKNCRLNICNLKNFLKRLGIVRPGKCQSHGLIKLWDYRQNSSNMQGKFDDLWFFNLAKVQNWYSLH